MFICSSPLHIVAFPHLVNKCDDQDQTPLIKAVGEKAIASVNVLLSAGGDPNIANKLGETAVYIGTKTKPANYILNSSSENLHRTF